MNTQELLNTLKMFGGAFFAALAMHGYMSQSDAATLMADLTTAVPALISFGSICWSIYSHWNMKKVPEHTVVIDPVITNSNVSKPSAKVETLQGTIVGKVVSVLLIAFVISAFLAGSGSTAQAQVRKPGPPFDLGQKLKDDFSNATGVKATGDLGFDLLKALDAKLLPDLNYALKLAQATNSNVTAPCWQAWIDMINTQQTAVKNADGTEIDTPDPHLVTTFERMVELRNALQPDSKFMTACSPVANLVKQDVIKFMGIVISGGTGLATMIPGL